MVPEKIGYKTMNPILYYAGTLGLYLLEVWLSIQITSVAQVFGFIGAFAGSSLGFFIPSILFSKAYYKFASQTESRELRTLNLASIANFLLGILFFSFFLYACVLGVE